MQHLCDHTVADPGAQRDKILASKCEYPPFRHAIFIPAKEGLINKAPPKGAGKFWVAGKLVPREVCRESVENCFSHCFNDF